MQTIELIKEINKLPTDQRFLILEQTIKSIKKDEYSNQMLIAADILLDDYLKDKELTAFSSIDMENFYEAR